MECKLRCVNFRRVGDPRRAFQPALRVTGISDDWHRSTMGVIVIGLGTPRSAGENFECTWELLGVPTTSLGAPATAGDMTQSARGMSWSAGGKSGSASNHSTAVCEKQYFLWETCWCTWKS